VRDSDDAVLVTGATGFLGKHLVAALLERGTAVRALGRKTDVGLELSRMGADFLPVDLRDGPGMLEACRGINAVVHSGALSSAWGQFKNFYDINVSGTENVIAGCRAHGVSRLIYISSPSVMSKHEPQFGLCEADPLPETFVSMYSETKAMAERRVQAAQSGGLATVVIRPKAIYGPGDQALFPRIVEGLAKGRLPILGDGGTVTNITHVQDVVHAILLALESETAVGNTYLVTGGEEVNLWEVISLVADRLGYARPSRTIPMSRALKIGAILEGLWRLFRLRGEPPLTRYKASVLGFSQTYDISAAKRDLGYSPEIRWQEGIDQFLESLRPSEPAEPESLRPPAAESLRPPEPGPLKVTFLQAGIVRAPERVFGIGRRWKRVDIPALFALLEHPEFGPVLFDTGYSTRFYSATSKLPFLFYRMLTPPVISPEENAPAILARRGIQPEDVKWIILSHFDPDHIGGLRDFPSARIVCSSLAWSSVAGKLGIAALKARLLPGLLPDDIAARLVLLPEPAGPDFDPFGATLDLFGDSSVLLVSLPGHADGHLGAIVRSLDGRSFLLCGDACWSMAALAKGGRGRGIHRFIAENRLQQHETYRKLDMVRDCLPDLEIVPSHCPLAAGRLIEK